MAGGSGSELVSVVTLLGAAVVAVLPTFMSDGLKSYASAAIFGATLGNFGMKKPKLALIGLAIPICCKAVGGLPAWLIILLSVFGTVIFSRIFYVMDKKKAQAA